MSSSCKVLTWIRSVFPQFWKFGLIGLINTVLFFAIYYLLLYFGLHYIFANFIAFVVTVLSAYYFNGKFVFKPKQQSEEAPTQSDRPPLHKGIVLIKVFAVYTSTITLSTGLLFLQVEVIGISELIAPLFNLCVTVPINFLLNKYWAFAYS